jgi:hypothetical protein
LEASKRYLTFGDFFKGNLREIGIVGLILKEEFDSSRDEKDKVLISAITF